MVSVAGEGEVSVPGEGEVSGECGRGGRGECARGGRGECGSVLPQERDREVSACGVSCLFGLYAVQL